MRCLVLLVAVSVLVVAAGKPLQGMSASKWECVYSLDETKKGKDLANCRKSCESYKPVIHLEMSPYVNEAYLCCSELSSFTAKLATTYKPTTVA